jgi:hypothetical protein
MTTALVAARTNADTSTTVQLIGGVASASSTGMDPMHGDSAVSVMTDIAAARSSATRRAAVDEDDRGRMGSRARASSSLLSASCSNDDSAGGVSLGSQHELRTPRKK